jgi:hypothetical protein
MGHKRFLAAILLCVGTAATAATAARAGEEQPICPDRPSKANGTCTVPAGHFQLETSFVDWTHDNVAGVRSDLVLWGSSFVKYGLNGGSDIELGFTPRETLRVRTGGEHDRSSGFGDVTVRVKQRLTRADAKVQATIIPFVKLPTARHDLGNGRVEGGITIPISTALGPSGVTLALGPEVDVHADVDGHGDHVAMAQLLNLGLAASSRVSFSAELWGQWDWESGGTIKQVSADGSVAYLVGNDVQLDAGANFGLNRNTPDVELYAGASKRF